MDNTTGDGSTQAVARYLERARRVPKLSREEEAELGRAWRTARDKAAANKLISAHLRYVIAIALRYRRYGIPVTDLIAEGNLGLIRSIDSFDPDRGNRLVTYAAYWIRAFILDYTLRSWSLVGGGAGALRSKLFFKLRRERLSITNLIGDNPDAVRKILAERLNVPEEEVQKMLQRLDVRDISLESQMNEQSPTLGDTLPSPDPSQEEQLANAEARQRARRVIETAMQELDPRERLVIEGRLLAHPDSRQSLTELGRKLGVSRERARQLEARALKKLKRRIDEISGPDEDWYHWAA